VLRAVQIARKLSARSKDLVVLARLSRRSLAVPGFVEQIAELAGGSGVATQLVFAFAQSEMQGMSAADFERLRLLSGSGLRLALDKVTDLRLDGRLLASRGFHFVRVAASLLLEEGASPEVHAADLSGFLMCAGVELIADGIQTEAIVADLLDFDITLAQGAVFSPPRPVRAEVLADGSPSAQPAQSPQGPASVLASHGRRESEARPMAAAAPATLGQAALQEAIDRLRKVQETRAEETSETEEPKGESERRSAWRMLARRVGAPEKR
jgi:cyclic-di-GMP phosphodiesterase, flagellum assembly factor TipF